MGDTQVEIPDKLYFKIGEVSELTGIKPYVLRYWETEFPLAPKKSRTGQRLYRREDIEQVREISRLLYKKGFTIAGARKHMASGETLEPEPVEPPEELGVAPETTDIDRDFLKEVRSQVAQLKKELAGLQRK